jgi:hypothetical protein
MMSTVRFGDSAVMPEPMPVDDQPDGECPSSPDEGADLPAGDHERRHDQRVERDRRLDTGDRGAKVVGHRSDGDVHDRGVQGHEELRGSQDEQDRRTCFRSLAPDAPGVGHAGIVAHRAAINGC